MASERRGVALVTGVGRQAGIGAAIVTELARDGWDIAMTWWSASDRQAYGAVVDGDPAAIEKTLRELGARTWAGEVDFGAEFSAEALFDQIEAGLGAVSALVVNHTHCVQAGLMQTTPDSFEHHWAVNVAAVLGLLQEFGRRYKPGAGGGRIVTITSDHTAGNVAYGVSKGAADRLTDAAAYEFGPLGVTANAVNPGPIDTGWMDDAARASAAAKTALPRIARTADAARLVRFLCSPEGGWITGQRLYSNGGFTGTIS